MVDNLIRLFASDTVEFTSNGIGALPDAISCKVAEERNGEFELEMEYPITGKRYSDIALRKIIFAKPNPFSNSQPFRIYAISKPINGIVTINAAHYSYDLTGYSVSPFTASTIQLAFVSMKSKCSVECPFTFWTDKTTSGQFKVEKPNSVRALLGGSEGSILDVYGGGEYEFDGLAVKLHNHRGTNRGVTIRYGKNLTDVEQEENCSEVYTGVHPYWYSESDGLVELDEKVVYASGTYNFVKIMSLDLTEKFDEKPTQAQLRQAAEDYISNNDIGVPKVSITVSFIQLSQSDEYKQYRLLEEVHLCDTVTVIFPELGVNATAKCIKTTYDVITGKYESVELGEARTNLADTVAHQNKELGEVPTGTKTFVEQAVDRATKAITGGLGGYVVLRSSTGGDQPDELLVMNTDNIETATKVWRWNQNGLGYSGTGYNGPYTSAMTADGEIVANLITAGEFDGSLIRANSIDSETIRNGWNGHSRYIQLEGAQLNIYDQNDQLLMSNRSNGQHFFKGNTEVGKVGTNSYSNYPNYKGLVFDLEENAGYMCWAAAEPGQSSYIVKLIYHHNNTIDNKGLHFACKTYADSNLYINDDCHFIAQNSSSYALLDGALGFSNNNTVAVKIDGASGIEVYQGASFDVHTNIDMHGCDIINQSDARLKTNIKDADIDALYVINSIDLKSFDWIESGKHESIGIIAQQLMNIAPELVVENKETGALSIVESKLVYYCIKAIQELSKKVGISGTKSKWDDRMSDGEKERFVKKLPSSKPVADNKPTKTIKIDS